MWAVRVWFSFYNIIIESFLRISDSGTCNGSHNVSFLMILKTNKVGQMLVKCFHLYKFAVSLYYTILLRLSFQFQLMYNLIGG